jgi:hypothetical protein
MNQRELMAPFPLIFSAAKIPQKPFQETM